MFGMMRRSRVANRTQIHNQVVEPKHKVRIVIEVSEEFNARLDRLTESLKGYTDNKGRAHTIRQSLQLYEYLITKYSEGASFYMLEPGEEEESNRTGDLLRYKSVKLFGGNKET